MSGKEKEFNDIKALQAENERLRELNSYLVFALEKLARLGNEPLYGYSVGNEIAKNALRKVQEEEL